MSDRRTHHYPWAMMNRRTRLYPRRKHEGPFRILFIDVLDLWDRILMGRWA